MVRTRGLPRSLGRGIGRGHGGQDEHHPDDVPRQSKPIASVRTCCHWSLRQSDIKNVFLHDAL